MQKRENVKQTLTANTQGKEWCKTCNGWKEHDSKGECRQCGRQLFHESTEEMIAEWMAKGYVA